MPPPRLLALAACVLLLGSGQAARPLTPSASVDTTDSAAICLVIKDQDSEVREWLAYHQAIGFDKVLIMDNAGPSSTLAAVIADYVASGFVQHTIFGTGTDADYDPQTEAYRRCLAMAGGSYTWLAAWDTDEYLIIPSGRQLKDVLAQFKPHSEVGGVVVNWQCLGSSGQVAKPPGWVLDSYWQCFPRDHSNNRHVKSIVRPERAEAPQGGHHFSYKAGYHAVSTDLARVDGAFSSAINLDQAFLYHYVVKSEEDFRDKMARGAGYPHQPKTMEFFGAVNKEATANCTALLDWHLLHPQAPVAAA